MDVLIVAGIAVACVVIGAGLVLYWRLILLMDAKQALTPDYIMPRWYGRLVLIAGFLFLMSPVLAVVLYVALGQ